MPKDNISPLENSLLWAQKFGQAPDINKTVQAVIAAGINEPYVVAAQRILAKVTNIETRIALAQEVQRRIPPYIRSRFDDEEMAQQVEGELRSFIHYLEVIKDALKIDSVNEKYRETVRKVEDITPFDITIYLCTMDFHNKTAYNRFLAFSQASYHYVEIEKDEDQDITTIPLYTSLFEDKIVTKSVITFCQSLLDAECTRVHFLKKKDDCFITLSDFPRARRNACFDAYIAYRANEERKLLSQDNEREDDPTLREAKIELLKKEVQNYKSAEQNPETEKETLRMAEYFINHLRRDLGFAEPKEEINPFSEELIIHNHDFEIDQRIKAVHKAKICRSAADYGVIMRLLIELHECQKTDYTAVANRINKACGTTITSAYSLKMSHALNDIGGTWKEGWKDLAYTRQSANLLNHFKEIARIFMK